MFPRGNACRTSLRPDGNLRLEYCAVSGVATVFRRIRLAGTLLHGHLFVRNDRFTRAARKTRVSQCEHARLLFAIELETILAARSYLFLTVKRLEMKPKDNLNRSLSRNYALAHQRRSYPNSCPSLMDSDYTACSKKYDYVRGGLNTRSRMSSPIVSWKSRFSLSTRGQGFTPSADHEKVGQGALTYRRDDSVVLVGVIGSAGSARGSSVYRRPSCPKAERSPDFQGNNGPFAVMQPNLELSRRASAPYQRPAISI